MENREAQIFWQLGEEGIAKLVASFYRRVREDELIGPMYQDDWEGAERRLRDFLIFRFGGPQRYIEERGHPRLRMRHAPFAIGVAERDRWLALMGEAMDETGVPESARGILEPFFAQVAEFLRNREEHSEKLKS
ncbi:globin [soil metagenome]